MKATTIRYNQQTGAMLAEIDLRPTTAVQIATELCMYTRRATLLEIKGKFSREEIIAMADCFNGTMPTWQYLPNTSLLIAQIEDGEKYQQSCSRHEAKLDKLLEKIKTLTAAQAAVLQLELYRFWNCEGKGGYGSPSPNLDKLVEALK